MKLTKLFFFVLISMSMNAQLVINEFMPSNKTTVVDAYGEPDDWAELFNYTDTVVHLNGWAITDSFGDRRKFKFKQDSIKPKGYFIVWLDNDSIQGRNHANFKLKAGGEFLMITNPAKKTIDSFFYAAIDSNVSYARIPNGTGAFKVRSHTFNRRNDTPSPISLILDNDILIFPNPSTGIVNIENIDIKEPIRIYNLKGGNAMVLTEEKSRQIKLSSGVYILNYKSKSHRIIIE
jgi:hypothetical protein